MAIPEFALTFRKLFPLIYTVAFRMVKERESAEDVTQDVFTVGYRKYQQFENQTLEAYRNYLWQVCRNRCLRVLGQHEGRAQGLLAMQRAATPEGDGGRPLSMAVRQLCETVLTEEEYVILSLYYVEGYGYEEIAELLTKSTTSVFGCVKGIKERLRAALSREDIPDSWIADATRAASDGVKP